MPRRVVRRAKTRSAKRTSKVKSAKNIFHVSETGLNPYDFVIIGFLLLVGLYLLSLGLGGTGASISPITFGLTGAAVSPTGHAASPPVKWWDLDWQYRVPVKVKELAVLDHNDYIVEATVDTFTAIAANKMRGDCGDIRIIGENNKEIQFEIDSTNECDLKSTLVRMRTNISAGFNGIFAYIYYGNSGAQNAEVAVPYWRTKAPMTTARSLLGAVTINGKIYALGGADQRNGVYYSKNEVYNPVTDEWKAKENMPGKRFTLLSAASGNRIYIIGGMERGDVLGDTFVYFTTTDVWATKKQMLVNRSDTMAATADDKIYVIGGSSVTAVTNQNEEYNPAENVWTKKTGMPTARQGAGVAAVGNKIYVIGGQSVVGGFKKTEVYSPIKDVVGGTNIWETKADMPTLRAYAAATVIDSDVYVIGGYTGEPVINKVEIYDTINDKWRTVAPIITARAGAAAASYNGKIYVLGGEDGIGTVFDENEEYTSPNWKLNVTALSEEGPDTTAPAFSNLSQTTNATTAGKVVTFSARWSDVSTPLKVWFYDSYTGKNSSAQPAESGQKISYEFDTAGIPDNTYVRWKSYAEDDAGNVGISDELSFLVTGGPTAPTPNATNVTGVPITPGADTDKPTASEILLLPATIDPGMEALIRVRVADNEGLKEATLEVDGEEVENVPLGGTRGTAEFTWKPDAAAKYDLAVLVKDSAGNVETVEKTVTVGKVSEPAKPGDNTAFIAIGAVLIVIAAVIVLYYLKKKGKLNFGGKKSKEGEDEELTAEELGLEGPKY